jgi:hypothetical protein
LHARADDIDDIGAVQKVVNKALGINPAMAFSSSQRKKSRIERFGHGGVQAKTLLVRVTSAQSCREVYLSKLRRLVFKTE